MSKKGRKVPKLTDEQYNEYIAALRNDAALYKADGEEFVPPEIDVREPEKKQGE